VDSKSDLSQITLGLIFEPYTMRWLSQRWAASLCWRHSMADQSSNRPARRRDFWFAYAAWFVLNGIWFVINIVLPGGIVKLSMPGVALIATWLIVLLNVGVPIALAFTRPLAALGTLTAIGTLFAFVVVEGLLFVVGARVGQLAGGPNVEALGDPGTGLLFVGIGLIGFVICAVFLLRIIHRRIR